MLGSFKRDYKEALLRSFFALVFICGILGISMNKILVAFRIKNVDPLVSLQINYSTNISVWSSFICGASLTGATAQTLKRGKPDNATDLSQSYIQNATTDHLATGDWTASTGSWPCFIFNPGNDMFFKPGEIDQIILLGFGEQINSTSGLLFGIFDGERNISSVEPFVGPVPSINTFTFTREERMDITNVLHSYFFVNKQNTIATPFGNKALAARFLYSPDSYLVLRYTEKVAYTPYDLISAVGGLTTYAIAIWIILFGRGKYRSWGLIQRYLLRNSPDARKKDDSDSLLPISYEKNNNFGTPTHSSSNIESDERSSMFYFTNSGTPTQQKYNTNSLSPNSVISSPYNAKDLNKRIDSRINQKLWFVEQTLSRHYLSGFKLRRYDADLRKLGLDTSHDDEVLTPPAAHHNWNNFDAGVRNPDQNHHRSIQVPIPMSPTFRGSQYSNNSVDSLNPEETRTQYPNVAIGQVPLEKKQRGRNSGSGNYQQFVNAPANGMTTTAAQSYYSQITQGNVESNNPIVSTASSQLQMPLSGVISSSQEQVQGPLQGPPQE